MNIILTETGENLKEKAVLIPLEMAGCISLDPNDAQALYTLLCKILGQQNGGGKNYEATKLI